MKGMLFSQSKLVKDLAHGHDFSGALCRSEIISAEHDRKALVNSSWPLSMHVPMLDQPENYAMDVTMTHASNTRFSAVAR